MELETRFRPASKGLRISKTARQERKVYNGPPDPGELLIQVRQLVGASIILPRLQFTHWRHCWDLLRLWRSVVLGMLIVSLHCLQGIKICSGQFTEESAPRPWYLALQTGKEYKHHQETEICMSQENSLFVKMQGSWRIKQDIKLLQ
jgi:hypothetical protein